MTKSETRGIVYVAVGEEFVKEASLSAARAKSVMPEIPITLLTDNGTSSDHFDNIIQIENPRQDGGDRVFHADLTPYDRTLYIDTDIYIAEPISDIFDLLDSFDIAACINQRRYSTNRIDMPKINDLPESFPEYNGGVLAFRQNSQSEEFLSLWQETFRKVVEYGQVHNQAALRYAMYHSNVRIATIPNEYNCVFRRPGSVNGEVKVFHGRLIDLQSYGAERGPSIEQAVDELNRRTDLRTYYRVGDRVHLSEPSIFKRAFYSIQDRGVINTLKIALSRIKQ